MIWTTIIVGSISMKMESLKNLLLFFLIFLKKVIRTQYLIYQTCILRVSELLKTIASHLKYTWLCSLNGNKKCLNKIKSIKDKLEEEEFLKISKTIPEILENGYVNDNNPILAFQLGYWYEKISPEIDFEKSYLWYSVSVSSGVYKAMKMRDRVGKLIEKKKITEIQLQANEILTKNKYFNSKKDVE